MRDPLDRRRHHSRHAVEAYRGVVVRQRLDYVSINAAAWNARGDDQMALARRRWRDPEPRWGIFDVPESQVGLLPAELGGAYVVELGCGTAYVSAWLARAGARPIGVDPAEGQLRIARQLQDEFSLVFPLVRAVGEEVPLGDGTADHVISEYGAAIWADPHKWVPEAARLLRPGGELVFLGNSTLLMLCVPDHMGEAASDRLLRDHFGMHRFAWPDDPTIEFHLGHGDWIRLLRGCGLQVEDLIEIAAPPDATSSYDFVTAEWARRWPCEEVWRARKA
jgi:SAM-dependent methyltransferase